MMREVNRRGEPVVTLYSKSNLIVSKVTDWFTAEGIELVVIKDVPPTGVQGEVLLHTCGLNSSVERAAARINGLPAVVPEALDWVLKRCKDGLVSTMIGHDWVREGMV